MQFEWDEAKNLANIAKHGLSFEAAIEVLDDPRRLTEEAHTVAGERRLQTIGLAAVIAVVFIVYTFRLVCVDVHIRMISARPASRRERTRYDRPDR